jgi:DNA-binding MltR family transcriptional regulator
VKTLMSQRQTTIPDPVSAAVSLAEQICELLTKIRRLQARTHAEVAIVGAAIIEEKILRALLTKMRRLSGEMHKRLFDGYGPLSSFSGKIDVAYALQIITKEKYDDLTTIRKLRNKFAHSMSLVNFDSVEIRTLFKEFSAFDDATRDYQVYYLLKLKEIEAHLDHVIESGTSTMDKHSPDGGGKTTASID